MRFSDCLYLIVFYSAVKKSLPNKFSEFSKLCGYYWTSGRDEPKFYSKLESYLKSISFDVEVGLTLSLVFLVVA